MTVEEEQLAQHERMEEEYVRQQAELSSRRTQQAIDRAINRQNEFSYRTDQGILMAERRRPLPENRIRESSASVQSRPVVQSRFIDDSTPNYFAATSLPMNDATRLWLEYNIFHRPVIVHTSDIGRATSLWPRMGG